MGGGRPKFHRGGTEQHMVRSIDELAQFEQFKAELLPYLRDAVKRGATAEEIYKKAEALAAARSVTIAATELDPSKAMTAIKDILDRSSGKATDRKEVTHKYKELSDSELDAMLLNEASEDDELEEKDEGTHLQ